MRQLFKILLTCALALALLAPAQARHGATCTAAEKQAAQAALARYLKAMPKQRAAYFKTHRSKKQRAAFVKKQQAKLKRLRVAAACRVPPPPDTTPPKLTGAQVNGATLVLAFDQDVLATLTPPASVFSVRVDGLRWRIESFSVSGRSVEVRLGLGVNSGEAVEVQYDAAKTPLADAAGNPVAAFAARAANVTPAAPAPPLEPGFALSLPKPSFADNHAWDWQPSVGEWGPKADPYWLPTTGTFHGLIIPVDFADAPASRTVEFYRDYLVPPSEGYFSEASYGRLTLDLHTIPRWLRMPKPAAEYRPQWGTRDRLLEFLRDATALADSEVNFASIDVVYVIAPESLAGTLDLRLARPWPGEGLIRDGKELRWAVMGGAGIDPRGPTSNLAAHHIVTHETGHFFGLPDLYDQAARGTPDQFAWAGRWDLMSDNRASSHLFAWHKWLLRWLDPTQLHGLTSPGTTEAELTPLERKGGLKAVVVPVSSSVAYVIEDRQRIGEDIELCDKGVLVWIVDSSRPNVERNAVVQPAHRSYNDECGAIYDAGYDLGASEISTFEDVNVRMNVLEAKPNGNYRISVTRK